MAASGSYDDMSGSKMCFIFLNKVMIIVAAAAMATCMGAIATRPIARYSVLRSGLVSYFFRRKKTRPQKCGENGMYKRRGYKLAVRRRARARAARFL